MQPAGRSAPHFPGVLSLRLLGGRTLASVGLSAILPLWPEGSAVTTKRLVSHFRFQPSLFLAPPVLSEMLPPPAGEAG